MKIHDYVITSPRFQSLPHLEPLHSTHEMEVVYLGLEGTAIVCKTCGIRVTFPGRYHVANDGSILKEVPIAPTP